MKIFISSPGDVDKERRIAERLIERLAMEFAGRIPIEPYFWEYEPMRHDRNFQDQIPPTTQFDLIICILWSRLGTPLKGPDGREYASGTEYEILSAREAQATLGRPEVLVYRNLTPAQIRQLPAAERRRLFAQLEALDNFISRYCVDPESGAIKGAFTTYQDLGEFEIKLEKHLRKLIEARLPPTAVSLDQKTVATWTSGSPFRGLEAFDFAHAPIFFGRVRAIGDVLALLRQRMAQVEDARAVNLEGAPVKPAAFVLVSAMSGVGKSSLVRAGVLPLLVQPGDGIALWRRAVMRPGEASDNLFDGLARALCRPEALPELVSGEATIESIGALLRRNPAGIEFGLSAALDHASGLLRQEEVEDLRQWEKECRQQGRLNDAGRAVQLLEELKTAKKPARLVLVIDQLEELFTLEKLTPEERDGFVLALAALARSGKAYVIATLRSDFFARCAEAPLLVELSCQDGLYHLTPPTPEEIGQIIRQPAQAAGLRFEVLPQTGQDLAERLRDAAIRNPEALPLLEFCLEELYQGQAKRNDGWLRHADYEAMGGLEGALRQRAEAVYSALKPEEKEQFGHVMRAVTTVALDEAGIFNRRWADDAELAQSAAARGFVEAFLAPGARLFVADQTDDGRKIVSVAHEALLSAWPMLRDWLTANRENLQIRANLSTEAKRWRESGRNSDYLCPPGLPLEKARQVQREGFLNREENDYVRSSVAKAEAVARRRVTVLRRWLAAVGLLAVLAVAGACYGWWNAQKAIATLSQADLWCGVELVKQGKDAQALASLARAVRGDPKNHAALVRLYTLLMSQHSWPLPLTPPLRHEDEVLSASFSPDGTRVVTASQDKTARIWDASTGQPIGDPMRHEGPVNSASFSPDGKQVVTASNDGTARLWDASTGQPVGQPMRHDDEVYSAAFSPDGTRVVTASADKTARLWDAHTGQPIGQPLQLESCVNSASFSPDGARVITACGSADDKEAYAQLWDARTGQPMGEPMRHQLEVISASFSPDGTLVVTASSDGTARLWNGRTGQPRGEPLRHQSEVLSACFSPDGTRVVTASQDKTARLWDAHTGQPMGVPMVQTFEINSARFSPDGKRVVTACWDKTTRLWDAHTGQPIGEPMLQGGCVNSASFSPDGTRIITASNDYTARLWDAHTCQPLPLTLRHDAAVVSARFSPDGTRVITGSLDKTARLWDASTGQPIGDPMLHDSAVISTCFSPDGTRAVTGSLDKTARLWDAGTGQPMGSPMRHDDTVSASFSPDGNRVVTASLDKTAHVWDAHTGQPVGQPLRQEDCVNSACFSPDGTRIVTACGNTSKDDYGKEANAQLWDAQTGQPIGVPMVHEASVCSASFSPDGTRIVTASLDFTARLWDGRTGQPLGKPMRHDDWVTSASFSPDGARVVTASNDNTARLWDAHTGQPDGRPMSHGGRVFSASFSPDSTRVLTASEDKTARLWDARTGQPISEPLPQKDAVISAVFSPDGTCVLTASVDKTAQIWNILPPNHAVAPAWLPDLAEAVAGLTISDSSAYVPIDPAKYFKLKAQLANASGDDFWSKAGRWFFADRDARTLSPLSAITVPEYRTREAEAAKSVPK